MDFFGRRFGSGWVRGLVVLTGLGVMAAQAPGAAGRVAAKAVAGQAAGGAAGGSAGPAAKVSAAASAGAVEQAADRAGTAAGGAAGGGSAAAARAASGTGVPGISAVEAAQVLPPPAGFDVGGRNKEVLAHLNAVIRFYRMSVTPTIQKVGEPSDALYREQAVNEAERVGELAFQSARAEALLLTTYSKRAGTTAEQPQGEAQTLQATKQTVTQRLADMKAEDKALDEQIAKAKAKQMPALQQQKEQVEGAIELNTAMSDALGRIVGMSDTGGQAGLGGDIARLERTAPELADATLKPVIAAPMASVTSEQSSGVSSQAVMLFQLMSTEHAIDSWMAQENALHAQAMQLRTPLTNLVRSTLAQGQALSQQTEQSLASAATPTAGGAAATGGAVKAPVVTAAAANAAALAATRKNFDAVTSTFKVLSAAAVPLSEEILTLEQMRSNLAVWRTAVDTEYQQVLRWLLFRVMMIALTLGILWTAGEVWRRMTVRYVRDVRRRRQLLVLRRIVLGFLTGIVLIFGFVTQFTSLATFAGFITAGLAVGLQSILLSVAAYFFIVGRYGVKVGDRITVASVTGDVIDVGLVRFYMMELAGSGTELRPTGRVAVFSNSVLFQTGTPLYKQMPGTEYAWHELTMKLTAGADYRRTVGAVEGVVTTVYDGYKQHIEQQHRDLESWMEANVDQPKVECRMQLVDGGLELNLRFPVALREAAQVDEQVTEKILALLASDAEVKAAVAGGPEIKATVKG